MSLGESFNPREMALRGRIGAYRLHATHDPRETTIAARTAFLARFEREVDPDATLSPEERSRRAEASRKAYFAKLAHRSAKARRSRSKRARATPGVDQGGKGHGSTIPTHGKGEPPLSPVTRPL